MKEEVSASRKLGAEAARALLAKASRLVVMKGKKVTRVDLAKDRPADAELMALMLGSTGNLRAPVVLRGKTLLVGFNGEIYEDALG